MSYVWLFVCLRFIVPLENFSIIWRRNHYRWRAASFVLCLALMAIEQWEYFIVPHLLWHGGGGGRGHPFIWLSLRTRDTYTYCWAFSSGADPSCFYDLGLSRLRFEHPTFRLRGDCSNPLRHRRSLYFVNLVTVGKWFIL